MSRGASGVGRSGSQKGQALNLAGSNLHLPFFQAFEGWENAAAADKIHQAPDQDQKYECMCNLIQSLSPLVIRNVNPANTKRTSILLTSY
jgi:hypothetical protein